LDNRN